jgi:hypothetical protein
VHPARPDALRARQQVRIESDLRHGAGLGGPGELRVDHLVVHPVRTRFPIRGGKQPGPDKEVRTPGQDCPVRCLVCHDCALVHDVGAAADGLQRCPHGFGFGCFADLGNVPSSCPEPVKHNPLVRLAALHQVLKTDVELAWRMKLSPRPQQVQPRQVAAREEVGDIARRQPQCAPVDLHNHVHMMTHQEQTRRAQSVHGHERGRHHCNRA